MSPDAMSAAASHSPEPARTRSAAIEQPRDDPMGPVYIVGLDRSGKTTMRAFVSSHSRIAIPAVGSNMWTYFDRRFGDLAQPDNLDRCLASMATYKHVRFLEPDFVRIRREFGDGPATYGRLFSLFLIHHAERQGKPRWGAQSGLVEQYADALFRAYPGLKVIHMVRDPRDRYEASLAKWPDGRGRAGGATARWLYSMRHADRNQRRYGDDYLIVRFEDLVLSTEATVRSVCAWLGEEFEQAMLDMVGAPELRRSLAWDDEPPNPVDLLSPDHLGRYRGRVPEKELRFIQLHARRLMRRYGYQPDPITRSVRARAAFVVREWPDQMARGMAWRVAETAHRRWPDRFGHQPGARMIVEPAAGSRPGMSAVMPRSSGGPGGADRAKP